MNVKQGKAAEAVHGGQLHGPVISKRVVCARLVSFDDLPRFPRARLRIPGYTLRVRAPSIGTKPAVPAPRRNPGAPLSRPDSRRPAPEIRPGHPSAQPNARREEQGASAPKADVCPHDWVEIAFLPEVWRSRWPGWCKENPMLGFTVTGRDHQQPPGAARG